MGAALMEPWVIALGSSIASVCFTIIGAVWWVGRNSVTIADLHELRDLAIEHRDELKEEIARERREVGEGFHALREKLNSIELDVAKNYMRRESFHQAMNQLQENIGKSDLADQQWRLRIEEKIDRLSDRMAEHQPRGR